MVVHPKMIIFSRKTHGCWVPTILGNPHIDTKPLWCKSPKDDANMARRRPMDFLHYTDSFNKKNDEDFHVFFVCWNLYRCYHVLSSVIMCYQAFTGPERVKNQCFVCWFLPKLKWWGSVNRSGVVRSSSGDKTSIEQSKTKHVGNINEFVSKTREIIGHLHKIQCSSGGSKRKNFIIFICHLHK